MKKIMLLVFLSFLSVVSFSQSKMYTVHKDLSVDSILISDIERIYFKIDTTVVVEDIDGNIYHTVKIGTQVWMVENLRTTKYRNGDTIPNVTDGTEWSNLTTGAFSNYNNDENNVPIYGRLYNWYAVNDIRNIAPIGWHVASDEEWSFLTSYLGEIVAGNKLKEIGTSHWANPNTGSTNETGFTTLPSGNRDYNGIFNNISLSAFFWSSSETDANHAWLVGMSYNGSNTYRSSNTKSYGFSVRCIKD